VTQPTDAGVAIYHDVDLKGERVDEPAQAIKALTSGTSSVRPTVNGHLLGAAVAWQAGQRGRPLIDRLGCPRRATCMSNLSSPPKSVESQICTASSAMSFEKGLPKNHLQFLVLLVH